MSKEYKEITHNLSQSIGKLRKEIPEVMNGFSIMAQGANERWCTRQKD